MNHIIMSVLIVGYVLSSGCGEEGAHLQGMDASADAADFEIGFDARVSVTADASPQSEAQTPPDPRCVSRDAPGEQTITVDWGGKERSAILYIPEQDGQPRPLLLSLHGHGSSGAHQIERTQIAGIAEREKIFTLHPDGTEVFGQARSWNAGKCCTPANTLGIDDVGFLHALVERIQSDYCVDTSRTYVLGFSNGGFMSYRLACEPSDRFAAFAVVSASLAVSQEQCQPGVARPIVHFHGDSDPLVPIKGNPILRYDSIESVREMWMSRNDCDPDAATEFSEGDARCWQSEPCSDKSELRYCIWNEVAHDYHGSGETTEQIWSFLSQFSL